MRFTLVEYLRVEGFRLDGGEVRVQVWALGPLGGLTLVSTCLSTLLTSMQVVEGVD